MAKIHHLKKIHGQETRGKTKENRLRGVDNFVILYDSGLLKNSPENSVFVDLGYGRIPITTLESAQRFAKINPSLYTIGIEIDKERVALAQNYKSSLIDFRHGGFNLPLQNTKKCCLIRAFNVLRQYSTSEVDESYNILAHYLVNNGLLVEGTSDPFGRFWVANILRKNPDKLRQECLVFATNFQGDITPKDFQTVLPKKYIECMTPEHKIYHFFEDWKRLYREFSSFKIWGRKQVFKESVYALAKLYPIVCTKRFISRGYLVLRDV